MNHILIWVFNALAMFLCFLIADQGLYKSKVDRIDKLYQLADVELYTKSNFKEHISELRNYLEGFKMPPRSYFEQGYIANFDDFRVIQAPYLLQYLNWIYNHGEYNSDNIPNALWNDGENIRKRLKNGLTETFIRRIPFIRLADEKTWEHYRHPFDNNQRMHEEVEVIYILEVSHTKRIFYIKLKDSDYIHMQFGGS